MDRLSLTGTMLPMFWIVREELGFAIGTDSEGEEGSDGDVMRDQDERSRSRRRVQT